jgi:hypothetical protein
MVIAGARHGRYECGHVASGLRSGEGTGLELVVVVVKLCRHRQCLRQLAIEAMLTESGSLMQSGERDCIAIQGREWQSDC